MAISKHDQHLIEELHKEAKDFGKLGELDTLQRLQEQLQQTQQSEEGESGTQSTQEKPSQEAILSQVEESEVEESKETKVSGSKKEKKRAREILRSSDPNKQFLNGIQPKDLNDAINLMEKGVKKAAAAKKDEAANLYNTIVEALMRIRDKKSGRNVILKENKANPQADDIEIWKKYYKDRKEYEKLIAELPEVELAPTAKKVVEEKIKQGEQAETLQQKEQEQKIERKPENKTPRDRAESSDNKTSGQEIKGNVKEAIDKTITEASAESWKKDWREFFKRLRKKEVDSPERGERLRYLSRTIEAIDEIIGGKSADKDFLNKIANERLAFVHIRNAIIHKELPRQHDVDSLIRFVDTKTKSEKRNEKTKDVKKEGNKSGIEEKNTKNDALKQDLEMPKVLYATEEWQDFFNRLPQRDTDIRERNEKIKGIESILHMLSQKLVLSVGKPVFKEKLDEFIVSAKRIEILLRDWKPIDTTALTEYEMDIERLLNFNDVILSKDGEVLESNENTSGPKSVNEGEKKVDENNITDVTVSDQELAEKKVPNFEIKKEVPPGFAAMRQVYFDAAERLSNLVNVQTETLAIEDRESSRLAPKKEHIVVEGPLPARVEVRTVEGQKMMDGFYEAARKRREKAKQPENVIPVIPAPIKIPTKVTTGVENQTDTLNSPEISRMIRNLGLTPETFVKALDTAKITEFADIAGSEGKVEWMLGKFAQAKSAREHQEAVEMFEKLHRESGFVGKLGRAMRRKSYILKIEKELSKEKFTIDKYKDDLEGLIHLANIAPTVEMKTVGGKRIQVMQYTEDILGIPEAVQNDFNLIASEYSNIPPESEWGKRSANERVNYARIKAEYTEKFANFANQLAQHGIKKTEQSLESSPDKVITKRYNEKDALYKANEIDFKVRMQQTLNNYPHAELMLKEEAEKKGWWGRKVSAVKTELGMHIGETFGGFASGVFSNVSVQATIARLGTKSALVFGGGATMAPLAMIGLGGWIGWRRGGMNAEKKLKRDEELMRFGNEVENTGRKRDVATLRTLFDKKDKIKDEIEKITKSMSDAGRYDAKKYKKYSSSKEKLEKKLKNIDQEISATRGTVKNFVSADKMADKIDHLRKFLEMDYGEYATYMQQTVKTKFEGPYNFEEKRKEWAEQLEVRIEYAMQKIEDEKISFDNNNSLKSRYRLKSRCRLIDSIATAGAAVMLAPRYDDSSTNTNGEYLNKFGKTRRGKLEYVLEKAEKEIKTNRESYVKKEKWKGLGKAAGFSLGGAVLGYGMTELVGSNLMHQINGFTHNVKAHFWSGGKDLEKGISLVQKNVICGVNKDEVTDLMMPNGSEIPDPGNMPGLLKDQGLHDAVQNSSEKVSSAAASAKEAAEIKMANALDTVDVNAEAVVKNTADTAKHFEYTLANEGQSREYALIKYYQQEKGLSYSEAGYQANKDMVAMYGDRGERALKFVHKGDNVVITEIDGKPHIEVVPKGHIVADIQDKNPSTLSESKAEQVTTNGQDVSAPYKEPDLPVKGVSDSVETGPADLMKDSSVVENLGSTPLTTKEVAESFASFEVKTPSNLVQALDNALSTDPRYFGLSDRSKDKVLYQLFVKQYLEPANSASNNMSPVEFYRKLQISSGNPFAIEGNSKLALDAMFDTKKDVLAGVYHDVSLGKVPEIAVGFHEKMQAVIDSFKGVSPAEMTKEKLDAALKAAK